MRLTKPQRRKDPILAEGIQAPACDRARRLRPLLGAGMSLVLFLATRGGFISLGSSVSYGDLYGTAALSVLSGMFSEQVSKKLAEIFRTCLGRFDYLCPVGTGVCDLLLAAS